MEFGTPYIGQANEPFGSGLGQVKFSSDYVWVDQFQFGFGFGFGFGLINFSSSYVQVYQIGFGFGYGYSLGKI